ncbi:hypothetical protein LO771_09695 [Streptacidiphilus sp. ASG 303]|uniref:hypothetical protein n=1 Tax=Streptacidiphilus sp. ASG 303 TaxID=2896847 RepID=UPI001E5064DE|nr:hypothetical protein [Streptacidiphilus sp. ASG 303]MCD0482665.1 hypothetical protein [Streptacidiphilus sp. ASG 303]
MAVHDGDTASAQVDAMRTRLDELLAARRYAVQRERRLAAELRSGGLRSDGAAGGVEQELAQARTYRERLGAECVRLGEELKGAEARVRWSAVRGEHPPAPEQAAGTAPDAAVPDPADAPQAAAPGGGRRGRPRRTGGARHGGVFTAEGPADEPAEGLQPVPAAPVRPVGARFGGAAGEPVPADAPQGTGRGRGGREQREQQGRREYGEHREQHPGRARWAARPDGREHPGGEAPSAQDPSAQDPSAQAPSAQARPAEEPPAEARPAADALAARVRALYAGGQGQQAAREVAAAAVSLSPADVAALAGRLHADGPPGSSAYLARAAAGGGPGQVAGVLALLRQAELVEEAQELFHRLWAWPPDRLVPLFDALERTGQAADAATLLWESASAPPAGVAALAAALADAGRDADLRSLLGQASSRAPGEVAALAAALAGAGRAAECRVLLRAVVRGRTADDVAGLGSALTVRGLPEVYGVLLEAAGEAEPGRRRDVAAALRLADLPLEAPAAPGRGLRGRRGR